MAQEKDPRLTIAGLFGSLPAVFLAMGQSGFFFEIPMWVGVPLVVIGGVVAGLVQGRSMSAKAGFAVAWVVGGLGMTVATLFYLSGRSSIINYELLIPAFIGGLPGLIVGLVVSKVTGVPAP
ncbi:MAG: hypothetical protein H6738_02325 [Alphaproteobacteria bacterium]|nr:hypothetical protein [Alphaproteobacteria bacterium]MCB9695606.1 hypothetical protein [Alphaproteobacteria bacterium]